MEKGLINYDDLKLIETLKHTVAQGLSDSEFRLFIEFCKSTKLNPCKKEIWAIKAGGRLQLMTGINGYLTIANSHPMFDGMEVDVELLNGKPVKAVAKVYRKDRKYPSVGIALMSEFGKSTPVWQQMPSVMLTKVAKSIALREAFTQELGGTYTEEEMPREYSAKVVPEVIVSDEEFYYEIPNITKRQQEYIESEGALFDPDKAVWVSNKKLHKNLDPYLKEIILGDDDTDSLEKWHDEINAPLQAEKPLDRIKKRVAEMESKP